MQRADELDFDYVVTGHYSVIEYDEGLQRYLLRKSPDVTKDQSLCTLLAYSKTAFKNLASAWKTYKARSKKNSGKI